MPTRLSNSGEEENERQTSRSSRRINKFENSQYYIMPLGDDFDPDADSNLLVDNSKQDTMIKNTNSNNNNTDQTENNTATNETNDKKNQ